MLEGNVAGPGAVILLLFLAALYFLPTIVAAIRHHHNSVAIFVLNLLLGWSVIGWIVALVMSFTNAPNAVIVDNRGPINN